MSFAIARSYIIPLGYLSLRVGFGLKLDSEVFRELVSNAILVNSN